MNNIGTWSTVGYMYKSLEAKGLQLRVVKHRNWMINISDVERAIDKNTRLLSALPAA